LIDLSNFDYAVTAMSAAVCNCGVRKKSVSMIELLEFRNDSHKSENRNYLQTLDKKIVFPASLEQLASEVSMQSGVG
jgi:hypothetical protein